MPPSTPSAGFKVSAASASPSGTDTVIRIRRSGRRLSRSIRRGPGLIAHLPTGTASPGRVATPTPHPAVSTRLPSR